MAAMFNFHMICGHIAAFKRALICWKRFSRLWENCADGKEWHLSVTSLLWLYLWNRKGPPYLIYTWSVICELSNESKFVEIGSAISEKIVRVEKTEICRLRHLYSYISGAGSGRHI